MKWLQKHEDAEEQLRTIIQGAKATEENEVEEKITDIFFEFEDTLAKSDPTGYTIAQRPNTESEDISIRDYATTMFQRFSTAQRPTDEAEQKISDLFGILLENMVRGSGVESVALALKGTTFIKAEYKKIVRKKEEKIEKKRKRKETLKKYTEPINEWWFDGVLGVAMIYGVVASWSFRDANAHFLVLLIDVVITALYFALFNDAEKKIRHSSGTILCAITLGVAGWVSPPQESHEAIYFLVAKKDSSLVRTVHCAPNAICNDYALFFYQKLVKGYPPQGTIDIEFNGRHVDIPYRIPLEKMHSSDDRAYLALTEDMIRESGVRFLEDYMKTADAELSKRKIQLEIKRGDLLGHLSVDALLRKEIEQEKSSFIGNLSERIKNTPIVKNNSIETGPITFREKQ